MSVGVGARPAGWNLTNWYRDGSLEPQWVLFFAAASVFTSGAVAASVWGASSCFSQVAVDPLENNTVASHFDSCFVVTERAGGGDCLIRCTSSPTRLGVTATLLSATAASIVLMLMRLRAYWVRARTPLAQLYVEHVLAPEALADNSQTGRQRLAAARRAAKHAVRSESCFSLFDSLEDMSCEWSEFWCWLMG